MKPLTAALLAAVLAAPASAQWLQSFEGQFLKAAGKAAGALGSAVSSAAQAPASGTASSLDELRSQAIGQVMTIPLLPFAMAAEQEARSRGQHRVAASTHHISDRIRGWGGSYRYSAKNHLSFEAHWTAYLEEGAEQDLHYLGARLVAELLDHESWSLDYALGVSGLVGRLGRGGPDISLGTEYRPHHLLFFDARAGAVIMEGGTLGELRGGAGLRWRDAELRAGYKALVGPFETLAGPELGVRVRL